MPNAKVSTLRSLHVISGMGQLAGGPSYVVRRLCETLGPDSCELMTFQRNDDFGENDLPGNEVKTHILNANAHGIQKKYEDIANGFDVIHDHGFWLAGNRMSMRIGDKLQKPVIVTPHGILRHWALKQKRWKKRIGWLAFGRSCVRRAAAIHVTSKQELEDLLALASVREKTSLIPFGIDPVDPADLASVSESVPTGRRLLFLSRFLPSKGLFELLDAWSQVRADGWKLVIAGPDETGMTQQLIKIVEQHGMSDRVTIRGPAFGAAKSNLFRESDVFILPSHGENFGVVVGEALSAKVPVIATQNTPWSDLVRYKCGWWVRHNVADLREAILAATSLSDEQRSAMGQRGYELVKSRFSWSLCAVEMRQLYLSVQ